MSDTDYITIGRYVVDKMPGLTEVIKEIGKPNIYQILQAVVEVLNLDISTIASFNKETALVDGRIIFTIITLVMHDPERLRFNKKSKIIHEIALLLKRTDDSVYYYITQHKVLSKCNASYKTKFKYVSETILKGNRNE